MEIQRGGKNFEPIVNRYFPTVTRCEHVGEAQRKCAVKQRFSPQEPICDNASFQETAGLKQKRPLRVSIGDSSTEASRAPGRRSALARERRSLTRAEKQN